ncbi:Dam family site-specific DNA-(adenine-N6)-methyltransferase [Alginatibacterium sediminis]|uniref:Site-specific DNA-methyltransferase (adenine-specific) n=1 Tax=Alginatibacterium sediminis TaxID=2164068 RepID=A0A420EL28_9ALTE|nr:Dam family site-specific DNA-(adenine-N6)-methyltransferase [Alginatibacterium sediminis]RKF21340.1 Dam family site-specific DNA-(adenine-N6)-methyltransferase [Alginatibacterium sediminis]
MKKTRAFLKWAGGKYGLIDELNNYLPEGDVLIEPFVGAGSVFLNTNYSRYELCDINPDLITMYRIIQKRGDRFIKDAQLYFNQEHNDSERYYEIRKEFNACQDSYQRALMFLYMNRHGYNGLCRYNKKGIFNVPFGRYKRPYFPHHELEVFAEKSQRAKFRCCSYVTAFKDFGYGDVVYCDPPYAPISKSAQFTSYSRDGFGLEDQKRLGQLAEKAQRNGATVVISNHDLPITRDIYQGSLLAKLQVKRTISPKGNGRKKVAELIALYPGYLEEAKVQANGRG